MSEDVKSLLLDGSSMESTGFNSEECEDLYTAEGPDFLFAYRSIRDADVRQVTGEACCASRSSTTRSQFEWIRVGTRLILVRSARSTFVDGQACLINLIQRWPVVLSFRANFLRQTARGRDKRAQLNTWQSSSCLFIGHTLAERGVVCEEAPRGLAASPGTLLARKKAIEAVEWGRVDVEHEGLVLR